MNSSIRMAGIAALIGAFALGGCSSSAKGGGHATTTSSSATSTRPPTSASGGTTTSSGSGGTVTPGGSTGGRGESATFVSPSTGFVLEQDGTVAGTTDGGHSWHRVGHFAGSTATNEVIRYIGPTDGFAFARLAGALSITHDAGASWITLTTPFSNVADLAIADGTVYVVAMKQGRPPHFEIWSTPVGHLVWKKALLTLPVGAGPVPVEQIVLAGARGWILDQDRTVIAGARLGTGGSWTSWNAPCLHVEGPAYLAASTTTDLFASCDEGVWGGNYPRITPTAYVSHDGGTSFARHFAPSFGPILSPSPQTAVVAGEATLRRTTDGGATWSTVGSTGTGATTDWGFTSSTQGFVITGGRVLMTYDAGASWKAVTLP